MDGLDDVPITTDVVTFGKAVYGLGRNGSYQAAKRGVFGTITVQGRLRVPVRAELKKLAGDDPTVLEATTRDFLSKLRKRAKRAA
jgi:hypothetical protein